MQFSLTSAMFTRFTDDTQGLLMEMHSREQLNPFFFPGLFISNHHFLGDLIKVILCHFLLYPTQICCVF